MYIVTYSLGMNAYVEKLGDRGRNVIGKATQGISSLLARFYFLSWVMGMLVFINLFFVWMSKIYHQQLILRRGFPKIALFVPRVISLFPPLLEHENFQLLAEHPLPEETLGQHCLAVWASSVLCVSQRAACLFFLVSYLWTLYISKYCLTYFVLKISLRVSVDIIIPQLTDDEKNPKLANIYWALFIAISVEKCLTHIFSCSH